MLIHIIVCIITTVFFIYQFKRQRQNYQLFMCFWPITTLMFYIISNNIISKIFVAVQIVLAIIFLILYFKARNYRKIQNRKITKMNDYLNNIGVELYKDDIVD